MFCVKFSQSKRPIVLIVPILNIINNLNHSIISSSSNGFNGHTTNIAKIIDPSVFAVLVTVVAVVVHL